MRVLYNHLLYLLYWIINSLVLYLAYLATPSNIVLGNYRFSAVESAIYAGFWVTVFIWAMWDFVYVRRVKLEGTVATFIFFWALNFVAFWLVARFSHIAGFGIARFYWVIILAAVADLFQRLAWVGLVSPRKRRVVFGG